MSPQTLLLSLTFVSVNFELTLLIAALSRGRSPLWASLALAAFHAGYLLAPGLVHRRARHLALVAFGTAATTIVCLAVNNWGAAMPFVTLASAGIQALRRQLKVHGRTSIRAKNMVKLAGMCLAGIATTGSGLATLFTGWVTALALVAALDPQVETSRPTCRPLAGAGRWLLVTEFLHHAHYFAYCYVFWWALTSLPASAIGMLFVVGWLAYFVSEHLFQRYAIFSPSLLAAGHLASAIALIGMALADASAISMMLWFLTGVGGGTAYMLSNGPQTSGRETAEDAGHIAGTLLGGVLASLASVDASLVGAACLALATASAAVGTYYNLSTFEGRSTCA